MDAMINAYSAEMMLNKLALSLGLEMTKSRKDANQMLAGEVAGKITVDAFNKAFESFRNDPELKRMPSYAQWKVKAISFASVEDYPDYILEAARILNRHPSKIPSHAKYLTKAERKRCGIVEPEEAEAFFQRLGMSL